MDIKITAIADGRISAVLLSGPAGDTDIGAFFEALVNAGQREDPRPQLVDGRQVTDVSLTRKGLERMANLLRGHEGISVPHRVAFLADRDLIFGIFRMWEAERIGLGGEAGVFRDEAEAQAWLLAEA